MCYNTLHGGLLPAQKRTIPLGPLSALCSSVFSDDDVQVTELSPDPH